MKFVYHLPCADDFDEFDSAVAIKVDGDRESVEIIANQSGLLYLIKSMIMLANPEESGIGEKFLSSELIEESKSLYLVRNDEYGMENPENKDVSQLYFDD